MRARESRDTDGSAGGTGRGAVVYVCCVRAIVDTGLGVSVQVDAFRGCHDRAEYRLGGRRMCVKHALEYADRIRDVAQRTGRTARNLWGNERERLTQ